MIAPTTLKPATSALLERIRAHRIFQHPMFAHWSQRAPEPKTLGAMFHQIQMFCASTRPGLAFPGALGDLGLTRQRELLQEIVESEAGHGAELARMAGFLVNQVAGTGPDRVDVRSQASIEADLKRYSDQLLGGLPGYDFTKGLAVQTRRAIEVFERRSAHDAATTIRNLGTALALEIVSNRHLIPGEKAAIVDSGNYGAGLGSPELHYLEEHWGECGAEQHHEMNVIVAVDAALDADTAALIDEGALDFLDSLAGVWDLIDAALLVSGARKEEQHLHR